MALLGQPVAAPSGGVVSRQSPVSNCVFAEQVLAEVQETLGALEDAFQQAFAIVDLASGERIADAQGDLQFELYPYLSLLEEVARAGRPEIIESVSPLSVLAVPLENVARESSLVAISVFATDRVDHESEVRSAVRTLELDHRELWQWIQSHQVWPSHAVLTLAESIASNQAGQQKIAQLTRQVADVSTQLLNTFEEIALLHRLTQHLSLSGDIRELGELAASWLADVVPAECIAISLKLNKEENSSPSDETIENVLITHGECSLAEDQFEDLIARLGPRATLEPLVLNRRPTSSPDWFYPEVDQLVSVPIREGKRFFGWLLALNHTGKQTKSASEETFGTVESSLMSSVAVILGIHSGNVELYREQSDLFASVIRAFTSAIDAKDPYTRGHSERVAHLSVCLARQLGCSQEELETLYLAGLLHDIGKIGIDTNILRKPDHLTDEEYEHVKLHPELGYQILHGVKQLDKSLPVVLHHHEAWDGNGYPHGLRGKECPQLARIAAVADAIDAMSSDRPYRKGMPDEKLDEILRSGAGQQWDPEVIRAVFEVREEIREIGRTNRRGCTLNDLLPKGALVAL